MTGKNEERKRKVVNWVRDLKGCYIGQWALLLMDKYRVESLLVVHETVCENYLWH